MANHSDAPSEQPSDSSDSPSENLLYESDSPFDQPTNESDAPPEQPMDEDSTFFGAFGPFNEGMRPKTLLELNIIYLSAAIRSKPNWFAKINEEEIVSKWKEEAVAQGASDELFHFAISYTKYIASQRVDNLELSVTEGVYQTDGCLSPKLRDEFIARVKILEDVPEVEKDWHPNSDERVLDLVHPSLFCLVHGITRQTKGPPRPFYQWCGSGEIIPRPSFTTDWRNEYRRTYGSENFQWLPSEFNVQEDGSVKIESYINNLHPHDHAPLYICIEKIFERFVPLFERVLTFLKQPPRYLIPSPEIPWYDNEPSYEDEDAYNEWLENREPKQPSIPKDYVPPVPPEPVRLAGKKLQVIVKLANIELTPDKPTYPGGAWHVEGTLNERIVASGIYYYDVENITGSNLSFRTSVQDPEYEQNDNEGVLKIFGLTNDGPLNQHLGDLTIKNERCIAFPNTLQHRVSPFELEDKTRKGWRKILVFFLVDPSKRILSTGDVPPQQKSWMIRGVMKMGGIRNLTTESLVERVFDFLVWPMSMEKAKEYRLKLMKERKRLVKVQNGEIFERPFSLCEH